MIRIFIIALCLLSLPARAETAPPNELGLTANDCRALVDYVPSPDVDYKPGVDVHGKPVVEADLTPPVITAPEVYSFPLTVDTARYLGMSVPDGVIGEARIGMVTLEKGQLTFNGNPLEGPAVAALKAYCASKKPPEPPQTAPK